MDYDAKTVGQTLQQVPIGDMIKSYAIGLADAQWALDQKSIAMAAELLKAKVTLPDRNGTLQDRSLLELGFAPTFYHFQEATIEVSVSLTMKVEQSLSVGFSAGITHSTSTPEKPTEPDKPTAAGTPATTGTTPATGTPPTTPATTTPTTTTPVIPAVPTTTGTP